MKSIILLFIICFLVSCKKEPHLDIELELAKAYKANQRDIEETRNEIRKTLNEIRKNR